MVFRYYLVGIMLLTFITFGVDKVKAICGAWRIPERRLLTLSWIGGAGGALLAMLVFRHKIRKDEFKASIIGSVFVWIFVLWLFRGVIF